MSALYTLFEQYFQAPGQVFYAPGRVTIIGEHTDYNEGLVLPMAIGLGTRVAIRARADDTINLYAANFDETCQTSIAAPLSDQAPDWSRYILGMFDVISQYLERRCGIDACFSTDLPLGAGLSSSASLTVAAGLAYSSMLDHPLPPATIAHFAQEVEHDYAGTHCGIMDQMACAAARADHALMLDCQTLEITHIPFDAGGVSLLICDTGVKHNLSESAYNNRREECEQAARLCNLTNLRALTPGGLTAYKPILGPTLLARARHVVEENKRVRQAATALYKQNWQQMGALLYASHASLRDNFAVSCPELDYLVALSDTAPGVYGARMTGGGFGGCTIHLVADTQLKACQQYLCQHYQQRFGSSLTCYTSKPAAGMRALPEKG